MKYSLTLKGYFEKLNSGQGHDLIGKDDVAYQSVDPYRLSEHIYHVFITLAGLYQNLLPKNCWLPFMTWMTLRHDR